MPPSPSNNATLESEARAWIEALLQRPIFGDKGVHEALRERQHRLVVCDWGPQKGLARRA